VLTFTNRNFNAAVPEPGALDDVSKTLLQKAQTTLDEVDRQLARCHFKEALKLSMAYAQDVNRYLDDTAPWKMIKQDRQAAGTAVYTAVCAISTLKTLLYPFLPFTSQKLHNYLGFDGDIRDSSWQIKLPAAGQKLPQPQALFVKLEDKIVEEEMAKMGIGGDA